MLEPTLIMKILPVVLTLLFLQQAACTHLETCDCHEIKALMNSTVENETSKVNAMIENAIIKLESKFNEAIESKFDETNQLITSLLEYNDSDVTDAFIESKLSETGKLLKQIQSQLSYHHLQPPPVNPQEAYTRSSPAASCKVIHDVYPDAPSGYYWIEDSTGSPVQVYCKMDADCSGYTGGWMRVAYIDMRNSSHRCPSGFSLQTRSSRRVCDWTSYSRYSCRSTSFPVHGLQYHHVYGRVIAYQMSIPRAFYYSTSYSNSIDRSYVYGVSLTHGQNPRKHIWTFAGAIDESSSNPAYTCPCINQYLSPSSTRVPSFIGNDYFCDTAISSFYGYYYNYNSFHSSDPLWDGQGCGSSNTCCSVSNLCTNSPPWFIKHLPSATSDDVELRFCRPYSHGSTPIEVVELYVQ